jgi:hypothetical protein
MRTTLIENFHFRSLYQHKFETYTDINLAPISIVKQLSLCNKYLYFIKLSTQSKQFESN